MDLLRPATRFICCFPLSLGVKFLLWLHFASCVYTCGMALSNVLLQVSTYGYATSMASQIFSAAWSMAGVPIIAVAIWGAAHKMEPPVRYYLFYLVASAVIDTVYLIDLFLVKDACVHIELAALVRGGRAFACGMARMFSGAAAVIATIGVIYMVHIVWSFCEELADTGSSGAISELLRHSQRQERSLTDKQWLGRGERLALDHGAYSGGASGYNSVEAFSGRPHVLYPQPA
mmetsp:Transcript_48719/g.112914  ORF Transcript_48719/g.112914 Transcript_48719/m.112914 type:complete len:232 (-) Transcript_48719:117-812(-)